MVLLSVDSLVGGLAGDVMLTLSGLGRGVGEVDENRGGSSGILGSILTPILTLNGLASLGVDGGALEVLAVRVRLVLEVRLGSIATSGLGHSTLGTLRRRHRER